MMVGGAEGVGAHGSTDGERGGHVRDPRRTRLSASLSCGEGAGRWTFRHSELVVVVSPVS